MPRTVPNISSITSILLNVLIPGALTLPVRSPVTLPVTLPVYSAATALLPASSIFILLLFNMSPIKPLVDSIGIFDSNACLESS